MIPRADSQQNEYVPPSEERLAWLTGLPAPPDLAIVLTEQAAVFVDGRYTLQAAKQIDTDGVDASSRWSIRRRKAGSTTHLTAGDRLGFDPWLHTSAAAERLAPSLRQSRRGAGRRRQQPDRRDLDTNALRRRSAR